MRLQERTWLKDLRESFGLTQEKVSIACGVSRQAVTAWELGTGAPAREAMFLLATLLGDEVVSRFAMEAVSRCADAPGPEAA